MFKYAPEDIIDEIKKKQMPVIIYGVGVVGKVLLDFCEKEDIAVECFCDGNKKVAQSEFCGKEVIFTPNLKARYKDAIFLISVAAIKDTVDLLQDLGFSHWYAGGLLLNNADYSQGQNQIDYVKYAVETCVLCHQAYLNPEEIFFRSLDFIITERCTLRCKDCSNLMQYYEHPKDCDINILLKSLDVFCSIIDKVLEFRIIGGEALLNKDWPIIVEKLTNEPKVKRVVLYTNGTIVPNGKYIRYLKHSKILFNITNYGGLSRKINELTRTLEENKIAYYVVTTDEWLDCAAITPHIRGSEESQKFFRMCCAKNMPTLSEGKLFRCPYSANAFRLKAVPDNKDDYVDLFRLQLDAAHICQAKEKVQNYILHKDFLKTCDYCNGRPLSGLEVDPPVGTVQPALQINKPREYYRYTTGQEINQAGE